MPWTTPRTWVTGETLTSTLLNTHVRDNEAYLLTASVPPSSVQTFTDSGSTDFYSAGLWLVEVIYSAANMGGALVHCGTSSADGTTRSLAILASGSNTTGGILPTYSVVNNNTTTGAFRVTTAAGSGGAVTVTYRRVVRTG